MSKMKSNTSVGSGGIGFLGLLTILFIGLKLTGYIDWSWLWVLAPLWMGFSCFFGAIIIIFLGLFIWESLKGLSER